MKIQKILCLFSAALLFSSALAQDISKEILGEWNILHEENACCTPAAETEFTKMTITDFGFDTTLDTVLITVDRRSGGTDSSLAILELDTRNPDLVLVQTFEDNIWEGWKHLSLPQQDSLNFGWLEACNACHCGGKYKMAKSLGTNIKDLNKNSISFTVFPNPALVEVQISFPDQQTDRKMNIKVLNGKASIIREMNVFHNDIQISLQALPCGIYYIVVENEDHIGIKKLIKI